MKKIYCAAFTFLVAVFHSVNGQVATGYTFSSFQGTYTSITPATVLYNGTFDDNAPILISIPAFTFDGTSYTQMYVGPNGYVGFGGTGWTGAGSYTPLAVPFATLPVNGVISPFGRDLENADSGSPQVGYSIIGNEIVVQWRDVHRYNNVSDSEIFSFQLRLNTATFKIDMVYGNFNGTSPATGGPQVGLRGPTNNFATDVKNRLVNAGGSWAFTAVGTSNASTLAFNPPFPASGQTFEWAITVVACTNPPAAGVITGKHSVCPGSSDRLTLSGQTPGTLLQWQTSNDSLVFTNIAGATAAIYNTPAINSPRYFRIKVTCADSSYTNVFSVNNSLPLAGTITGPATGQPYVSSLFVLHNSVSDTILWQYASSPTGPFINTGTNNDSLFLTLTVIDTYYVRAVVRNAGGCGDSTATVRITLRLNGDNVCEAIPLNFGVNGRYFNAAATTQPGEVAPPGTGCSTPTGWCNSDLDFSMWFTIVAPASGRISVQSPDYDTQLALWSAPNCNALLSSGGTLVIANDDDPNSAAHNGVVYSSYFSISCLNPGQTYYLQLDAYSTTNGDSTRIILNDLGFANSSFTGLDTIYCQGSSAVALTPADSTGTFSGTGIRGLQFYPDSSGVGTFAIKYKVTACDSTVKIVRVVPNPVIAPVPGVTAVACFGSSTGAVNVTISGGTAPFSSVWSNGALTEDLTGIPAGSYSDFVSDVHGCAAGAGPFTVTGPPSALSAAIDSIRHTRCFGETNGSIAVTVSGGTPGYNFRWNNGSVQEDLAGLSAGVYRDTIRDAKGCLVILTDTITAPTAALAAQLDSVRQVSCNGALTGAIFTTVTGGSGPYNYSWTPGGNTGDLINISAGNYSGTVMDMRGCAISVAQGVVINQNTAIVISNDSIHAEKCNGDANGAIYVSVSGGAGNYQYHWTNNLTQQDIVNIGAGSYLLNVSDGLGCTVTSSLQTVTQPDAVIAAIDSIVNVSCHGGTNGGIYITVSGGRGVYMYNWSNQTTGSDLTNLAAGIYTATITDANGCVYQTPQPWAIAAPDSIVVSATIHNEISNGPNGAIDLTAQGGVAPLMYLWSSGATTASLSNLAKGVYQVTVTDRNGCSATQSDTVRLLVEGIAETDETSFYEVYPNPVSDRLFVKIKAKNGSGLIVELCTVQGQVIKTKTAEATKEIVELDIANIAAGNYLLRLKNGSNTVVKRVSVIR